MTENEKARPLEVIIVGAGIGGLTAALGLRQQGHQVTVFERSQLAQEIGAAIHLAPNCHGILRRLGIYPERFGANAVNGIVEYDADGNLKLDVDMTASLSIWQHPWVLSHRAALHQELKTHAVSVDGTGPAVVVNTSSRVVDVDCSAATITLADGSIFSGDLVLGADGVSSRTRNIVVGDHIRPFSSGKSAFRFMIPHQKIQENPATSNFTERDGYMHMWIGRDRRLVMYPCSNNTVMNFVGIHPSELSAVSKGEGWNRNTSKDVLLDVYRGFGPVVQSLLGMVEDSAVWTLLDMERIPHWVKGRLALLGDAAHPFLPHQGQGGGIAIEDAASLSALLPGDTKKEDIPERLELYEKLRDERAHRIQHYTRLAGTDLADAEAAEKFNIMEFMNYNFGHDEWHNSSHALKKHLWERNGALHWRSPLSFGPMPSPRQDHYGRPIPAHDSRFITHSVRFKTSATYLKTLFPTCSFSFTSLGTVAEASFQCTELDGLRWLGGGGYRYFGLWIHGVHYEKADGTKILGSYLPVLLENLADPITTGREELGMPKLGCEIEVSKDHGATSITCSWRGATFINIRMDATKNPRTELSPTENGIGNGPESPAKSPDEALLLYRYVPSVGNRGAADAAYPVMIRNGPSTAARVVEKALQGTRSSTDISVTERNWQELPTLHHVAAGLAHMPIYSVVESKVEEGHGVDDLSGAERIE